MKVLLHSCCAPCSTYPVEILKNEGHQIHALFFNPNIHPYTEYRRRLETFREYCQKIGIEQTIIDQYNISEFLRNCIGKENSRCQMCYQTRLDKVASIAKEGGFDAFTTTLLVSPYQKHELIKKVGEDAGEKYGVKFLYRDFREGFRQGQQMARDMGLYMQKYCGCIYSEEERYLKKPKKEGE